MAKTQNKLRNISKKRSCFDVLNKNTNIVNGFKSIALILLVLGVFFCVPILTRKIIIFFDPSAFSGIEDGSYLLCMFTDFFIVGIAAICITIIEVAIEKLSYTVGVLHCLKNLQYLPATVDDIKNLNLTLPELFVELSKAEIVNYYEIAKMKWFGFDMHIKFLTDAVTTRGVAEFYEQTAKAIHKCYKAELSKKNLVETQTVLRQAFVESLGTDCYAVYEEVFGKCLKAFVPDVYYGPDDDL